MTTALIAEDSSAGVSPKQTALLRQEGWILMTATQPLAPAMA